MGQVRKVGDVYYIEFIARGLMYSQPAGKTQAEAIKLLNEVEGKIAQGEALTIVREIELGLFFEKYLIYSHEKFSNKSIQRFISAWVHWIRFLKDSFPSVHLLSQITPHIIESYKADLVKKHRPRVINFTILLLREILEYGISIGFINDNPSLHITLLPWPERKIIYGRRAGLAKELLQNSVSIGKACQLLKLNDIAKIIYWADFIHLKRKDVC